MAVNVNVRSFGAVGDGVVDDRAAIQSAIDYASANGGGTVYIPTGTYVLSPQIIGPDKPIGCIFLKNNVSVVGDGIGLTNLKLQDGVTEEISGIVRSYWNGITTNQSLSKLTIDGNRDNVNTYKAIGFLCGVKPENNGSASNIFIDSVEIRDCVSYGFDPHEITANMVIKNSIAHGNGLDGFVADYLTAGSNFTNNVAWNNDRHGFNVTTSTPDFLLKDNVAYENGSAGLVFQRGGFDIPWPEDSTVQGGAYFDNAKEGILVRLTEGTEIYGADVFENGTNGVRFRAATNSVMKGNVVRNNSQNAAGVYDDVNFVQEQDSVTGNTYGSIANTVEYNTVFSDGLIRTRWNIREQIDSSNFNIVKGNVMYGGQTGLAKTSGSNSSVTPFSSSDPLNGGVFKQGTDFADTILGATTHDTVLGLGGADSLNGGSGNDVVAGGDGFDTLLGGNGNDRLYGGDGNDSIRGDSNDDTIFGDAGDDSMDGGSGNDRLYGGDGNDTILGGGGNDSIMGLAGNDSINSGDGNDSVFAGEGNNVVSAGTGHDTVFGGESVDSITGGSGNDFIYGFGGNDSLAGNDNDDAIGGGEGNDTISGGNGNDVLSGGEGNDSLSGDSNNDTIGGDAGNDTISGGNGADSISGGTGNDSLSAGADNAVDVFYFSATSGHDVISQFNVLYDKVQIDSDLFASSAQVLSSLTNVGGNAVLTYGSDWSITFNGVLKAQFDATDFVIV